MKRAGHRVKHFKGQSVLFFALYSDDVSHLRLLGEGEIQPLQLYRFVLAPSM